MYGALDAWARAEPLPPAPFQVQGRAPPCRVMRAEMRSPQAPNHAMRKRSCGTEGRLAAAIFMAASPQGSAPCTSGKLEVDFLFNTQQGNFTVYITSGNAQHFCRLAFVVVTFCQGIQNGLALRLANPLIQPGLTAGASAG